MGKGYTFKKKGKGPVSAPMQELIRKLKEDPSQLDSSGFGKQFQVKGKTKKEVEKLLAKKLKEKKKKKTA